LILSTNLTDNYAVRRESLVMLTERWDMKFKYNFNIAARSRKHFCDGNIIRHCVCIVETDVTIYYIKILSVAQQCFYGQFVSLATIKST